MIQARPASASAFHPGHHRERQPICTHQSSTRNGSWCGRAYRFSDGPGDELPDGGLLQDGRASAGSASQCQAGGRPGTDASGRGKRVGAHPPSSQEQARKRPGFRKDPGLRHWVDRHRSVLIKNPNRGPPWQASRCVSRPIVPGRTRAALAAWRSLTSCGEATPVLAGQSLSHFCGCSSVGRARPCHGRGHEFETRHPLHVGCVCAKAPARRRACAWPRRGPPAANRLVHRAARVWAQPTWTADKVRLRSSAGSSTCLVSSGSRVRIVAEGTNSSIHVSFV